MFFDAAILCGQPQKTGITLGETTVTHSQYPQSQCLGDWQCLPDWGKSADKVIQSFPEFVKELQLEVQSCGLYHNLSGAWDAKEKIGKGQ